MGHCAQNRNYMDEMLQLICEIDKLKPEPEVCNVRCPPFGCPRGPCPGMCCYEGICDPCCISEMPRCPPAPHPPRCCAPPCLPCGKANFQSAKHAACTAPRPCTGNPACPRPSCIPRPPCGPQINSCHAKPLTPANKRVICKLRLG